MNDLDHLDDDLQALLRNYVVTRRGEVFTLHRGARRKLSVRLNDNGYRSVDLWRDGSRKHYSIYWLVARVYLGARPSINHVVCHRNGNAGDDRAANLYWGTYSDNLRDAWKHGAYSRKRNA